MRPLDWGLLVYLHLKKEVLLSILLHAIGLLSTPSAKPQTFKCASHSKGSRRESCSLHAYMGSQHTGADLLAMAVMVLRYVHLLLGWGQIRSLVHMDLKE